MPRGAALQEESRASGGLIVLVQQENRCSRSGSGNKVER